jgi:hypothetical protein
MRSGGYCPGLRGFKNRVEEVEHWAPDLVSGAPAGQNQLFRRCSDVQGVHVAKRRASTMFWVRVGVKRNRGLRAALVVNWCWWGRGIGYATGHGETESARGRRAVMLSLRGIGTIEEGEGDLR